MNELGSEMDALSCCARFLTSALAAQLVRAATCSVNAIKEEPDSESRKICSDLYSRCSQMPEVRNAQVVKSGGAGGGGSGPLVAPCTEFKKFKYPNFTRVKVLQYPW